MKNSVTILRKEHTERRNLLFNDKLSQSERYASVSCVVQSCGNDMNIHRIIERLEQLMAGYNYVAHFGVDVFQGVTVEHFNESLRKRYPDVKPERWPLKETTPAEIFSDIQYGFDYRGDSGSGLKLTPAGLIVDHRN